MFKSLRVTDKKNNAKIINNMSFKKYETNLNGHMHAPHFFNSYGIMEEIIVLYTKLSVIDYKIIDQQVKHNSKFPFAIAAMVL